LLVDEDERCLWSNIIIKWPRSKLRREAPSAQETRDLTVVEHSFFWFTDGKISKREFVRDWEGLQAQISPQCCSWTVDSIGGTPIPSMDGKLRLTHEGLDQRYRTYLEFVNAKQLESALSTEFWYSQLTHNGKPRFLDEYWAEVADLFSTMSDIRVNIHLLLLDVSKQRIHVHIKATGTFRSSKLEVREHNIYQFVDRRISRIWQFFDTAELKHKFPQSWAKARSV
jgi:predicted ester cyclase